MALRTLLPVALMVSPLLALPLVASGEWAAVFQFSLMLHVVGALWLLWRPTPPLSRGRLTALRLAIGAPSALYLIVMAVWMTVANEGWEGLPFVLLPAPCVWPFMLAEILRKEANPEAGSGSSAKGPRRFTIPLLLALSPVVALPVIAIDERAGGTALICTLIFHAIGADWLLVQSPTFGLPRFRRIGLQLAIGLPSASFAAIMLARMIQQGDLAWLGLPLAVLPALVIWPFVLVALARVLTSETASSVTRSES